MGKTRRICIGANDIFQMTLWSEHCKLNFENKRLILAAEMATPVHRDYNEAEILYIKAVKSAKDHKFVHEEAIASELAGERTPSKVTCVLCTFCCMLQVVGCSRCSPKD